MGGVVVPQLGSWRWRDRISLSIMCSKLVLTVYHQRVDPSPHLKSAIPQSMGNGHEKDYGGSDSRSVPIYPIALEVKSSLPKMHPTIHSPLKLPIGDGNNSPSENNCFLIHSYNRPTRSLYHVLSRLNLSHLLDIGLGWVYRLVYPLSVPMLLLGARLWEVVED
jgi:hypothetical protein